MNVFDLSAKLTLDKSNYENGLNSAQSTASSFGSSVVSNMALAVTAITAVIAVAVKIGEAFGEAVEATSTYGDSVDKMSQKVGMSTDAYQEWDAILQLSGTSMQECSTGFKTLTNKIDEARNGSTSAQATFKELGISVQDLQSMSREDIFSAVITGLQNMTDETSKASTANDLFGRSGQSLMPLLNMTAEETNSLKDSISSYGMVMSNDAVRASAKYQDSLTILKGTMAGVRNAIISQLLPALTKINEGMTKIFAGKYKEGAKELETGLKELVTKIKAIMPQILQAGIQIVRALVEGISSAIPEISEVVVEILRLISDVLIANIDVLAECAIRIGVALVEAIVKSFKASIKGNSSGFLEGLADVANNINPVGIFNKVGAQVGIGITKGFKTYTPIAIEAFRTLWSEARPILADGATTAVQGITQAFKNAKTVVGSVISGIVTTCKTKAGEMGASFGSLGDSVGSHFNNATSKIQAFISDLGGKASIIRNKAIEIGSSFSDLPQKISDYFNSSASKIATFASDLGSKVATIKDRASAIGNAFSDLPSTIGNIITSVVGKFSAIPDGLASMASSVSAHIQNIINYFWNLPSELARAGQQAIQNFWNGLSSHYDSILNDIDRFISRVKSAFSVSVNVSTSSRGGSGRADISVSGSGGISEAQGASMSYVQNIYVNKEVATADELARAIRTESRFGLMTGGSALG